MLRYPALLSRTAGTLSISHRTVRHAASTSKPINNNNNNNKKSPATSPPPLVKIENGTFFRSYPSSAGIDPTNRPLLAKIDFTLDSRPAEETSDGRKSRRLHEVKKSRQRGPSHWAVIGPGSTTFLNILRGQHIAVPPKSRSYPYLSSDKFSPKNPKLRHPSNAIQYVGFSGEGSQATGGTRGAYLSARYESLREETDWTALQYLKGQTELNPLEGKESAELYDETLFQEVVRNLRLQDLLDMPVSNLSNGQTRRTRIAKSLLAQPELLLLDEPFMGLDPATTDSISSLLRNLANQSAPRVLLSLRPQDPIPGWITHVLELSGDKIAFSGEKELYLTRVAEKVSRYQHRSSLSQSRQSLKEEANQLNLTARTPISLDGEPIIQMDGVRVQYGEKVVLGGWKQAVLDEKNHKEGLQWQVRRGQRWAILGANGSGKTTLLSIITSDHPQAYALPVRLFGRSRLPEPGKPAISIFDLQSRIGHSSPEIHAFFPRQLTIRASIESAWADTFLAKPVLKYEIDTLIDRVLEHFRPELDPNFADTNGDDVKGVDLSFMPEKFQKKVLSDDDPLEWQIKGATSLGPDQSTQYAESMTFGQLTIAQQRLVLFIRAIIKKQDLIILDEAFSGMPASMREKCFALLNSAGPSRREITTSAAAAPGNEEEESIPQLPYLGPEQALLVVSHLREEIPDSVRFWMRLPSEVGEGKKLNFALGVVPDGTTLAEDQDAWKTIWSVNSLTSADIQSTTEGVPSDAEKYHYVLPRVD